MRQYSDDDIEVLGREPKPARRKISIWWFITVGIVAAIAIFLAVFAIDRPADVSQNVSQNAGQDEGQDEGQDDAIESAIVAEVTTSDPIAADAAPMLLPVEFTDSINDVVFTVISLEGCKAAVTFEKPDSIDCDVLIALSAADIRADNGQIVCEFIHNQQQLSRGVRKPGFCYISPDGGVSIGLGDGENYKKSAINDGGTFFRQYALVIDGEMQVNALKGKSKRRALAFLDDNPTIVISKNRESIYDFSQALADYGFSYAIYLPGSNSFLKLHTDKSDLYLSHDEANSEYLNYLIFKH